MTANFLEQLVAEWYEIRGYFVRRNVRVGETPHGGHEGELDVVAFNAAENHLVHIEPSMDSDSWEKREARYQKKFAVGRKYIPLLFKGLPLPAEPEWIALFVYGSNKGHPTVGGGKVVMVNELMADIRCYLNGREVGKKAIPEQFVIMRALQFAENYWL